MEGISLEHIKGILDEREEVSIKNARIANGLPDLIAGSNKCLRCNRKFKTKDKKNNRLCSLCQNKNKQSVSGYNTRGVVFYDE